MAAAIQHRGPDASGSWADAEQGYAVAFQRLAIIDLSDNGNQPMISPSGRYAIAFNGEIYNHKDIRQELDASPDAPVWRGKSDTEVLLAAIEAFGLLDSLKAIDGMFSFALWDRRMRRLILARDRFGEKPLFYGRAGDAFCFGSELKALSKYPGWSGAINRDSAALFLKYGYVPDPHCIFEGIYKLPPGHFIEVAAGSDAIEPSCYWSLKDHVGCTRRGEQEGDLLDELHQRLKDSVKSRMGADVPLGALLSGGIDSSLIVAIMQSQSSKPIKTFTIGFEEVGFDESQAAAMVARHLGTDHRSLQVTAADALAVIPQLPEIWDEPFADASQIPTYLVSKLTKEFVTVALSGDGGDELFCGYNRYCGGYKVFQLLAMAPVRVRTAISRLLNELPTRKIDTLMRLMRPLGETRNLHEKLTKLARVLNKRSDQFYETTVVQCDYPERLIRGAAMHARSVVDDPSKWPSCGDYREQMMYLDTISYLPGDILTKVDRASMAASLEVRAPFLNHSLAEFTWSLPFSMKMRNGRSKWSLREILAGYVPRKLFERPKMGFGLPIGRWLRGQLRDWAEDLLSEKRLVRQGLLEPSAVQEMWASYVAGKSNSPHLIWAILMLSAWCESDVATTNASFAVRRSGVSHGG